MRDQERFRFGRFGNIVDLAGRPAHTE